MIKWGLSIVLVLAAAVISGCAMNYVQTADEYRRIAPGGMGTEKVEMDVNRSLAAIGKTFEEKSADCLNVTITYRNEYNQRVAEKYLLADVRVTASSVEMVIREKYPERASLISKVPENGYVFFVIDVTAIDATKSHVVIYRPTNRYKMLSRSIIDWAHGKTRGCPGLLE